MDGWGDQAARESKPRHCFFPVMMGLFMLPGEPQVSKEADLVELLELLELEMTSSELGRAKPARLRSWLSSH